MSYISKYEDYINAETKTAIQTQIAILEEGLSNADSLYGPYKHADGDPYYIKIEGRSGTMYYNASNPEGTTEMPVTEVAGNDGNYSTDFEYATALAEIVLKVAGSNVQGRTVCVIDDDGNAVEMWYATDGGELSVKETPSASYDDAPLVSRIEGLESGVSATAAKLDAISSDVDDISTGLSDLADFVNGMFGEPEEGETIDGIYADDLWRKTN